MIKGNEFINETAFECIFSQTLNFDKIKNY